MPGTDILKSFTTVENLGGNFMQVFINNPYGKYNPGLIEKYKKLSPKIRSRMKDNNLKLVIHAPYTLNFAREIDYDSIKFKIICEELIVADMIGAIGCVIHVGKCIDMTLRKATGNMLLSLKYISKFIKDNKLKSKLILETAAGQGNEMFTTENNSMEGLASFYHMLTMEEKKNVKLCMDTCHIFSAGMDIRTRNNVNELFRQLKYMDLLQHIVVIHFNDSKKDYNSHVDRHEAIGLGKIGFSGLSEILKNAYKYKIPCTLETPDVSYKTEIPWIKKMINKCIK
jgi:deoxyribonuclease-4